MSYSREQYNRIKLGLEPKTTGAKPKKPIARKSEKKIAEEKQQKEERGDGDTELQKWFKARIKQLTGHCAECGAKTETKIYQYAILSVCHLLAKRPAVCPSVKIHPFNWIELCPYHHDQLDKANWKEIEAWGCWETIRDRLILVYPDIDLTERRFFPDSVLKLIEI